MLAGNPPPIMPDGPHLSRLDVLGVAVSQARPLHLAAAVPWEALHKLASWNNRIKPSSRYGKNGPVGSHRSDTSEGPAASTVNELLIQDRAKRNKQNRNETPQRRPCFVLLSVGASMHHHFDRFAQPVGPLLLWGRQAYIYTHIANKTRRVRSPPLDTSPISTFEYYYPPTPANRLLTPGPYVDGRGAAALLAALLDPLVGRAAAAVAENVEGAKTRERRRELAPGRADRRVVEGVLAQVQYLAAVARGDPAGPLLCVFVCGVSINGCDTLLDPMDEGVGGSMLLPARHAPARSARPWRPRGSGARGSPAGRTCVT